MAVQQRKKSSSRTRMKRAHSAMPVPAIMIDPETGEARLRHHVGADGSYRGRQVTDVPAATEEDQAHE